MEYAVDLSGDLGELKVALLEWNAMDEMYVMVSGDITSRNQADI